MNQSDVRASLHRRGICVIIPTYNNVGTVGRVVSDVLDYCQDVFVVDDGSTDGTTAVLQTIAGIHHIHYDRNRGKGHALKVGFKTALAAGFAYAITMDADGQHSASDIPAFLDANRRWPGSLILGSRSVRGTAEAKGSRFANSFSNFWFCVQTFHRLSDTQTGFRLYPLKRLYGYRLITARYEAELELLVFASWHGVALHSIPINVYYPPKEERVSHFRPGLDFTRISILNTFLCILALVYGLPLFLLRTAATILRMLAAVLFLVLPLVCIFTPMVKIYFSIGKATEAKQRWLHRLMYRVLRFAALVIGALGVRFRNHISSDTDFTQPSVIICNHQSQLDLIYLLTLTPRLVFLTNDRIWNNPYYGFIIRHAEYYPVSRGITDLMPHFESLVKRGYSIAIFPEGTRSADLQIGSFHRGAAFVADELGINIKPLLLYGTGRALHKHSIVLHSNKVCLESKPVITPEELQTKGGLKQQTRYLQDMYADWLSEVSDKMDREV